LKIQLQNADVREPNGKYLANQEQGASRFLQINLFLSGCGNFWQTKARFNIYVDVSEHIENGLSEFEYIRRTLSKRGRYFIFVSALMSLCEEFDRKIGHFRRYTKREVEEKCLSAGLRILKLKYFDLAGIVA